MERWNCVDEVKPEILRIRGSKPWIFEGFVHASPRSTEFASLRGTRGGKGIRRSSTLASLHSIAYWLSNCGHWFWGVRVLVMVCVIFGRGSVGVWSRGVICHFLGLVY